MYINIFLWFQKRNSWIDKKFRWLQVGHSIGAYISIEAFKRIPEKVIPSPCDFHFISFSYTQSCCFLHVFLKGIILHWPISIFGVKPTFEESVYHREGFQVWYIAYHLTISWITPFKFLWSTIANIWNFRVTWWSSLKSVLETCLFFFSSHIQKTRKITIYLRIYNTF